MKPTPQELVYAFDLTKLDIARLRAITLNLRDFIEDSGGEDRKHFEVEVSRYQSLLNQARTILSQIEVVAAERNIQLPPRD